ncbi:hypothetical protein N9901_01540 [Flavobacteriaceae bacterium]|nr:hypothetical protein [Flavobacteriaceae bacterium]
MNLRNSFLAFVVIIINSFGQDTKLKMFDKNVNDLVKITYKIEFEKDSTNCNCDIKKINNNWEVIFNKDKLLFKQYSNHINTDSVYRLYDNKFHYYVHENVTNKRIGYKKKLAKLTKELKQSVDKTNNILGYKTIKYSGFIRKIYNEILITTELENQFTLGFNIKGFILKFKSLSRKLGRFTATAIKVEKINSRSNVFNFSEYEQYSKIKFNQESLNIAKIIDLNNYLSIDENFNQKFQLSDTIINKESNTWIDNSIKKVNNTVIKYKIEYFTDKYNLIKSRAPKTKKVIIHNNNLLEKPLDFTNNYSNILYDYNDQIKYNRYVKYNTKLAFKDSFPKPQINMKKIGVNSKKILGYSCDRYYGVLNNYPIDVYTTKQLGLKYVKWFNIDGFLMKYTSFSKKYGMYTATAISIDQKLIVKKDLTIKDYNIIDTHFKNNCIGSYYSNLDKAIPNTWITKEIKGRVTLLNFNNSHLFLKNLFSNSDTIKVIEINSNRDFKIFKKYNIKYKQASLLIDKRGIIRFYTSKFDKNSINMLKSKTDELLKE